MNVRLGVARVLERGLPFAAPLGRLVGFFSEPALTRPVRRPARAGRPIPIVCVGGATLGGSGKTRVALACATRLRARGLRIALVGHAYRGSVPTARVVPAGGALATFGDEALVCARAFAGDVIVGPTRQTALDLAGERADVIVLDGPLRVSGPDVLAVLAVDAEAPWGSGAVVPAGDLRASRKALLRVADHVVRVPSAPVLPAGLPAEVGLFTAIARPARLVAGLAALGVHPDPVVGVADHGPLDAATRRRLTGDRPWLATAKCALHLEGQGLDVRILGAAAAPLPAALATALDVLTENRQEGR